MTAGLLAVLLLAAPPPPARTDFKVELFSNRTVTSIFLSSPSRDVAVCGLSTGEPCWNLPASQRMFCISDHSVHCRIATSERSFATLTVNAPIQITPRFAIASDPSSTFLAPSVQITAMDAHLHVTTEVDLESYVTGVLSGEASVLQSPAARRAMAIVARTWALRWQGRHHAVGFDFCSLTHCQAFRLPLLARADSNASLDPAANATRGQVLLFHGELADPYFTASCGGTTEAAGSLWPDRAQPYLVSIRDPYCSMGAHASWKQSIPTNSVESILRESLHLPITTPLRQLSVERRDASGRALALRAVAGLAWDVDANQFRYALDRRLGWQQIKSNLYAIERQGDSWIFVGHGLGHGVGLCQAGAEQMARHGASCEHILRTYFPGTEVALQPASDPDPVVSSEHFELLYPTSQEAWVRATLDSFEQWRTELGTRGAVLPPRVRVQTWATVGEFINATGQPGWTAGVSDGQSIALQPLQLLARKQILNQTIRHELTHLVVHRMAAKGTPRWFEEGSVLYFTGERIDFKSAHFSTARELDDAITRPRSEAAMKSAYAAALARVRQYARREGEAAVWRALEHPTAGDLTLMQNVR